MPDSKSLYEHLILKHNKNPRNFGHLSSPDLSIDAYNPLCGDTFQLNLKFDGNHVAAMTFEGNGCAISKASASMLTEIALGKTCDEIRAIYRQFETMLTTAPDSAAAPHTLGDLLAFAGVRAFPMRIKCAILPWRALMDKLADVSKSNPQE